MAIERALALATAEDCVVVAGKGHEATQTAGGTTLHFSDAEVVRPIIGSS